MIASPASSALAIGSQQLLRGDRVDPRRRRLVGAGDEPLDLVAATDQQAAGLERIAVVGVADHLGEGAFGHDQHRPKGSREVKLKFGVAIEHTFV